MQQHANANRGHGPLCWPPSAYRNKLRFSLIMVDNAASTLSLPREGCEGGPFLAFPTVASTSLLDFAAAARLEEALPCRSWLS